MLLSSRAPRFLKLLAWIQRLVWHPVVCELVWSCLHSDPTLGLFGLYLISDFTWSVTLCSTAHSDRARRYLFGGWCDILLSVSLFGVACTATLPWVCLVFTLYQTLRGVLLCVALHIVTERAGICSEVGVTSCCLWACLELLAQRPLGLFGLYLISDFTWSVTLCSTAHSDRARRYLFGGWCDILSSVSLFGVTCTATLPWVCLVFTLYQTLPGVLLCVALHIVTERAGICSEVGVTSCRLWACLELLAQRPYLGFVWSLPYIRLYVECCSV